MVKKKKWKWKTADGGKTMTAAAAGEVARDICLKRYF